MIYCPNCSCLLEPDEKDCPNCKADFGPHAAWVPATKPSGPIPNRPPRTASTTLVAAGSTEKANQIAEAERPYTPGRVGWANLSMGAAFLLSAMLSLGGKTLVLLFDKTELQSIPVRYGLALNVFANYWVVAILVYVGLRLAKAERWLRPLPRIHAFVGVGNAFLIVYSALRILAAGIEGGGPSFVVASLSPFLVLPAWLLIGTGFAWLAVRSATVRPDAVVRQQFERYEYAALAIAISVPVVFVASMYWGEDAPLRRAREATRLFEARCAVAGERILLKPTEDVRGLFLERDGSERYENIKAGAYQSHSTGILGEPLVNSGLLLFFETLNDRSVRRETEAFRYRRHGFKDSKGKPVDELEGEYGLYYKELASDVDRKLGLRGVEISIRDLRDAKIVATTTYFVHLRQRKFCGEALNDNFDVGQFAVRALNLKKRYPSAW